MKEIRIPLLMDMISKVSVMALLLSYPLGVFSEGIRGKVISTTGKPISDAVITSPGCESVRTDDTGSFFMSDVTKGATIKVWHEGFFSQSKYIRKNGSTLTIHLIEENRTRYNETVVLPLGDAENDLSVAGITNITRKDFAKGSIALENALKGDVAGLQVVNKSGMTGEGAYLQLRGVKTFIGENNPLIVINGVPFMPDMNISQIIGGYSRSVFQTLNDLDIKNITVLTGAQASLYGSLGSNGVIMIETDQATSDNLDTRISFSAIYGYNWNDRRIPLMNSSQYKSYLEDIGLTYYDNMETFFNDFSFLSDPDANQSYLYQYNTDWQKQIFKGSAIRDMLFRVEGGDNIAKYNISLGYMGDDGTLKNTNTDRYNVQINANVMVSKKFQINTSINAAYLTGNYQEQGLLEETNPLLTAYRRSPLLSPYASDMYGNLISTYSNYYYGAITNEDFIVSNPLAIVSKLSASNRQYNINAKINFLYHPIKDLTLNADVGMYYNYNQEQAFIPGINDNDIAPLFDQYGEAKNSVRVGTNHTFNMYYGAGGTYGLTLTPRDIFSFSLGMRGLLDSYEYDAAYGRNSNNDFYQTLGDAQTLGKYFSGYNNKWNWLSIYAHAEYTYDNFLKLELNTSYDGASSIGSDAARFSLYPACGILFMAKEMAGDIDWINKLNIYGDYGVTGNSRFQTKLGQYYYTSQPYQTIAGIVRATVPNTTIRPERDYTMDIGLEATMFNNRLMLKTAYYDVRARDVLINGVHSAILGTSDYYSNDGEIAVKGIEVALNVAPIYTSDIKWTLGGTFSTIDNKVTALGSSSQFITTISDDAQIITKVGENPYSFYGFRTDGVYATTAEAEAASLVNRSGVAYQAGDVKFIDQNGDGIIDDKDRVVLGSATPDFFGDMFSRIEYRNIALDATLTYSYGNDAYNAVRRITESGNDFSNQSTSLIRRWSMEGQITDIPRVVYGDNTGNNVFSDRWIENASFIRLRDITLSYTWDKPLWNFLLGGTVFLSAQNLFCLSDYLGLDPEFSYSYSSVMQGIDYAKVCAPRSVKFGIELRF